MAKRKIFIKTIGLLLLVTGLLSLFLVFAEFTSFYAFSEGSKFHYDGFGFGSLMFAFIVSNVMAYFTIAASCIPLGIGNLALKKWGLNLSLAFLRTILIIGATIIISFLFSFDLIKILEPYQTLIILAFLLIFSIGLPFVLVKFYLNPKSERLFENSDFDNYFEKQSPEKLTIILLNFFWILVFYLLIFLKGAFPVFSKFIFNKEGVYLLSTASFTLIVLTYLFYKNKYYAKFASVAYYIVIFFTFGATFLKYTTKDFLNLLNLPAYEMEKVVPAFWLPAGINLGFFFGILIIIQIFLICKTKIDSYKNG